MRSVDIPSQKAEKSRFRLLGLTIRKNKFFYLCLMIPCVSTFIFSYIPMVGVLMAFQDFDIVKGFFHSEWIGFDNFKIFLTDKEFYHVFFYTVKVATISFLVNTPAPIIFALLLNELRNGPFKRIVQSITYLPYFLSWVIVGAIMYRFFQPGGIITEMLMSLGLGKHNFLSDPKYFIFLVTFSSVWKGIGWGSIIYLSTITSINPELYEAAYMDGAGRLRQCRYVTIPFLMPTIVLLMIYNIGGLLTVNFDQIMNLQNDLIRGDTNVINTYIYYKGIQEGEHSLATAFGLFQNLLSFALLYITNAIAKKVAEISLW